MSSLAAPGVVKTPGGSSDDNFVKRATFCFSDWKHFLQRSTATLGDTANGQQSEACHPAAAVEAEAVLVPYLLPYAQHCVAMLATGLEKLVKLNKYIFLS